VDGVESWISGRAIEVPMPEPIVFDVELDEDDRDPLEPGVLLEMYQFGVVLMTERLVNALREAGVDNLQVFNAVIRDRFAGTVAVSHRVVNVVGVVACADMQHSTYSAPDGSAVIDVSFDSLVIDHHRAGGHLLFRLAESLAAIIVHQRVKDRLLAAGFDMLTFRDPAKYVS
jgi:hypothetical protein